MKIIASEVFSFFFGSAKSANRSFVLLREGEFFGRGGGAAGAP